MPSERPSLNLFGPSCLFIFEPFTLERAIYFQGPPWMVHPHYREKQLYQFQIRTIENNRTASLIMLRNKLNCAIKYALEQIKMLHLICIASYKTAPLNIFHNRYNYSTKCAPEPIKLLHWVWLGTNKEQIYLFLFTPSGTVIWVPKLTKWCRLICSQSHSVKQFYWLQSPYSIVIFIEYHILNPNIPKKHVVFNYFVKKMFKTFWSVSWSKKSVQKIFQKIDLKSSSRLPALFSSNFFEFFCTIVFLMTYSNILACVRAFLKKSRLGWVSPFEKNN